MFIPGGEGLGVVMIIGFIFAILTPFIIGFLISYFILKGIFINVKGKVFIKKKLYRTFITIIISVVIGYLFILFFSRDINHYIVSM